jgi:hypothetical protein
MRAYCATNDWNEMIGTVTDFIVGPNLSFVCHPSDGGLSSALITIFLAVPFNTLGIAQPHPFAGRHTKRASELSVIPFCRSKTARSEKLMRVRAATAVTA